MRIKDVAREAGVSTATVSHVINNTKPVSDATRERVLAAIERCNYYPNAQARYLASGRSTMLGLLVSDISNPFFPELIKSIESAACEYGYDVILSSTNYDSTRVSHYVRRFIERQVAGVMLMTSEMDLQLVSELERREVPVVFLDMGYAGMHMSNLVVDYEMGIEEAIRHLIGLGHRRIAYIGGPRDLQSARKRLDAFFSSFARYVDGSNPPRVFEADFKLEGGRSAAQEMLAAEERPTAVVVANDMMALGVMQECRAAGVSVPEDISIIGFDDIAFAELMNPPLSTVRLPRMELGKVAVEALMSIIRAGDQPGTEIHIPTSLINRGSTARARQSASLGTT